MARFSEGDGYKRENHPGLPYAGNPITDQDSLLSYYFDHPSNHHNQERPLGPLHNDETGLDYD